jgi:tRNA A37 methylthiotransferase MiaB
MKKIFVYVDEAACRKRLLDAGRICTYLSKKNYQIVYKPKDAQMIIFITCAVFQKITEHSLKIIKKFQKYDAELIVAGCLPAIDQEKLNEVFDGRTLITKNLDEIDRFFPSDEIKFCNIDDTNILFPNINESSFTGVLKQITSRITKIETIINQIKEHILKNLFSENSFIYLEFSNIFYFIRIAEGCLGNCSYCSIKKATGSISSKPLDQCLREFKKGLEDGYRKFVILAEDVGAYGLDVTDSLPKLLDHLTMNPGEYKISIKSIHPCWLVKCIDELEDLLKREKIVFIGIPIQSGSSRILKLMNRYSNTENMKDAIRRVKQSFPEISLYTHVIVGFPSETYDEFSESLDFINNSSIDSGYIYVFSSKPGTEAEKIEPKIPEKEIRNRLKYAKKFLVKAGYKVFYLPKIHFFMFDKKKLTK